MLTKKECEKALNALYDENDEMEDYASTFSFDDNYIPQCAYERARKYCFDTLKQLIAEHFDNPPLKFDDLKPGMWVWDDEEKWYMKIVFLFAPCKQYHFKGSFKVWADSCERSLDFVVFEENRFYRRQKEE